MKFNNPLRKAFNRDKQIADLSARLDEALKCDDLGEQLMRQREIDTEAYEALEKVESKILTPTAGTAFAGLGCLFGGVATGNIVLAGVGAAMLAGGMGVGGVMATNTDSLNALRDIRGRCKELEKKLVAEITVEQMANSPRFTDIAWAYPNLKEHFLLSTGREKVRTDRTIAPKPPTQSSGGTGFNI